MAEPVEAVLVGAGLRGRWTYGRYALVRPERLRIVALAEPDPGRRRAFAQEHGLEASALFPDWKELLERPRHAAAAIVATSDTLHVEPALAAIARGYHLLLEKPIATDPVACVRVVDAAERAGAVLQIGHVLRYTAFYEKLHGLVREGRLGELVHVEMKENVAAWHMTHSYVRGKFRSRRVAAPLLIAKACHDLDLLLWLVGRPPRRVASFGGLSHYRAERAPAGAPARCSDGCPVQQRCPHDAVRFYLGPGDGLAKLWPWSDLGDDPGRAARGRALESGPYGRCVYHCDNDVVDHQVLAVEFERGVTASFAVHGHASHERRTIRLTGSEAEVRGVLQEGVIELTRPGRMEVERWRTDTAPIGHFGGDDGLLEHFTDVLGRGAADEARGSGRVALAGHMLGFAAEEARRSGGVVDVGEFIAARQREAGGLA